MSPDPLRAGGVGTRLAIVLISTTPLFACLVALVINFVHQTIYSSLQYYPDILTQIVSLNCSYQSIRVRTITPRMAQKIANGSGGPIFQELWSPGSIFSLDQNFRDITRPT